MNSSQDTIKVLNKAIGLLRFFADSNHTSYSALDISKQLNISRTTVYRILDTFREHGIIIKDDNTGQYFLGWELYRIGVRARNLDTDYNKILTYAQDLSVKVGESVNISHIYGQHGLVVDSFRSASTHSALFVQIPVGTREPLYSTAYGKCLLFDYSLEEIRSLLGDIVFEKSTPNTLLSVEALYENIQRYRQFGYAISLGEYEVGVNAISAPVRNLHGKIEWAVSIAAPAQRVTFETLMEFSTPILETAALMSKALGYIGE